MDRDLIKYASGAIALNWVLWTLGPIGYLGWRFSALSYARAVAVALADTTLNSLLIIAALWI